VPEQLEKSLSQIPCQPCKNAAKSSVFEVYLLIVVAIILIIAAIAIPNLLRSRMAAAARLV
jgi:Tfp pilus assembly protein FimT